MKFFSGFSLQNESHFFYDYIKNSQYTVCGFSYGAIKAMNYAKEQLSNGNRIDTLQLFSPTFFQTKPEKFKRLQTISYNKSEEKYLGQFLQSCFYPYAIHPMEHTQTSVEELEELLYYVWDENDLLALAEKGITIEVYLGGEDKIINAKDAYKFFKACSTVTYMKHANHFLQIN